MNNCNCGQTVSKTGEVIHDCHKYEAAPLSPVPLATKNCKHCGSAYCKEPTCGCVQSRQATLDEAIEKIEAYAKECVGAENNAENFILAQQKAAERVGATKSLHILQGMKQ